MTKQILDRDSDLVVIGSYVTEQLQLKLITRVNFHFLIQIMYLELNERKYIDFKMSTTVNFDFKVFWISVLYS